MRVFIQPGLMLSTALIAWKALMCITGSESPMVVILSGSMEPGFKRGDLLFLHMNKDLVVAGEIIVFNVNNRPIPIVHHVIKMSEQFNQELALSSKIPTGQFNSAFEFMGCWQKDAAYTKALAFDDAFITLYSIALEKSQVILSDHVKQAVPSSWVPAALARILPYIGWLTIIMTENPIVKILIIGGLGNLFIITLEN